VLVRAMLRRVVLGGAMLKGVIPVRLVPLPLNNGGFNALRSSFSI